MFIWFSENRANYNKGQAFPFVIAAIAILVMMAMITANLGKLAIFKTDVSNAADAGALSGAAVLSSWLLGVGLNSDTWAGTAVVTVARIMEIAIFGRDDIKVGSFSLSNSGDGGDTGEDSGDDSSSKQDLQQFGQDLAAIIKLFITHYVKYLIAYIRVIEDAMMCWANAKQTALRAAFQNSGVDEQPDPSKKFKHYGGSYDSYVNDFLSDEANMTGFSQFMQHPVTGYGAPLGEIKPAKPSPLIATSGYGWTQNEDETFSGSFPGNNYAGFDNYVEVKVSGSITYPITALTFADYFESTATNILTGIVGCGAYLKYIGTTGGSGDDTVNELKEYYGLGYVLAAVYAIVTALVFRGIIENLPCGFTFGSRENELMYTRNNPLVVQVKRHKKNSNMGMWEFQYGDTVGKSAAHAFPENDKVTIEPVLIESFQDLGNFFGGEGGSVNAQDWISPESITSLAQGLLCMSVMFTMGGLMYKYAEDIIDNIMPNAPDCGLDDSDCVEEYLTYVAASAKAIATYSGGEVIIMQILLEYVLAELFCSFSVGSQKQDVTNNFNFSGLSMPVDDWFKTDLHLFETELYKGSIE